MATKKVSKKAKSPSKKKQKQLNLPVVAAVVHVDDERQGLPSASHMDADIRCLGRRTLCRSVPPERTSPAAARGHKIHAVLEGAAKMEELCDSDKRTAQRCMDEEQRIVKAYGFEGASVYREVRLWASNDELDLIYSAKLDTLYVKDRRALFVDYKTGWGAGVPIEKNWQMKSQAAVTLLHYDVDEIVCSLIHPNHPDSLSEVRVWSRDQVQGYIGELEHWCSLMTIDAPRTPNSISCLYCPAKDICHEYIHQMDRYLEDGKLSTRPQYELMSPQERGNRLRLFKLAEAMVKTERAAYKEMLEKDPASVEGWKLKGSSMRFITDQVSACESIRENHGVGAVDRCLELSIGKLEEFLIEKGIKKSDVKDAVKQLLGGAIASKEKEPSLVEA